MPTRYERRDAMEGDDLAEDDGNRFALLGLDDNDDDDQDDDDQDDADEVNEEGRHEQDHVTDDGIFRQQSQQRVSVTDRTAAAEEATAAVVGEALVGVGGGPSPLEEDHMGNDPYNPDDWNDFAVDEGHVGFDDDLQAQYLGFDNDDDDIGGSGDSDVDSLMDHGLAEVDNILRMKGRLSILDPPQGQEATALDTAKVGKPLPQIEEGGAQHVAGGSKLSSTLELSGHRPIKSARGTGAQAATSLKSGSVTLSPRTASGAAQPATASNADEAYNGQQPNRGEAPHVVSTSGGGNVLDGCYPSPTRRRRRRAKEPPFIQAKGLTLTYAQAKLFGLVGARDDPPPATIAKASEIIRNSHATTWRRSSSRENATTSRRSRVRVQERRHHNHTSYSPSRMEHLARPVPGKGRANVNAGVGIGGGVSNGGGGVRGRAEATFTWKRSRRAEAAMRDPACGYDFVREAGREREGFLRRVEAYSSYSRAKIETRRAEDMYAARLDKLQCPRCQNTQSYDEFATKKLKCPGCEVTYCMPKTWNRRVWDQRNQMCAVKSEERQARMKRETEEAFRTGMPRQSRHATLLRQRVGQVDFIRRMRRDLRRRRAREGNLTGGLQTIPVGVGVDDHDQHAGSRRTRPASAPIRSRARVATGVAAVATAQPPRCATAEEGAKRSAPRAAPSTAGRQGGSEQLPVTPEAQTASSTDRPTPTRPYGTAPLTNPNRDGLVAGPCGTPPPANPKRDGLVAGPHGTISPPANSNQDGLASGVSSRSSSSSFSPSAVRRPASAGARTVVSVATRPIKNSMQVRTAVGSLEKR